jgi:ankyrin repeat protein
MGVTPSLLLLAAKSGNKRIAELLLKGGVDPNIVDRHGFTPLDHAVNGNHADLVDLLLRFDACPNTRVRLHEPVIIQAVKKGNKEMVLRLIAAGADINIRDCVNNTPLMWAIQLNKQSIVELLQERGGV